MDRGNKSASDLIDELYSELSKLDEENLSFHNLVVVENLRELILKLKNSSFEVKAAEETKEQLPPLPFPQKKLNDHRIAIIDDDQDTQNLLKFYFKKNDIEVDCYISALEALEKIEDGKYDLLLVDLMMPEMTGFEFIQKIKNKIDINQTKILVGSAKNNQIDRMNALNLGALDFINKPYDLSELVMVIKRNLKPDAA